MAFYRSYLNSIPYSVEYTYTTCLADGTNPKKTYGVPINNANFNYPVIIGDNVIGVANLLRNCTSYNQDVHIPIQVTDCSNILADCPSFGANIYYHNSNNTLALRYTNVLYNKDVSKRVNIFFSGNYPNVTLLNKLVGSGLTWTAGDGYKYNTAQNIYLYNNYPM